MVTKIKATSFSGASNVHNGVLSGAIIALAAAHARRVVASLSDITDNGGGTNDAGGLRLADDFTPFAAGTGDAVAQAEFETAIGVVRDGIKEIVAQCNTIRAKAPAFVALTDSMSGNAADGTIAAIDDSMTGTDAAEDLVSAVGAQAAFDALNARMAQACHFVNLLRKALGMAVIASELELTTYSTTFAALAALDTGDPVGGTDAEDDAAISKAEGDAALDVMSDNIKTLSTAVNAMTADANANAALDVVVV